MSVARRKAHRASLGAGARNHMDFDLAAKAVSGGFHFGNSLVPHHTNPGAFEQVRDQ